MPGTGDAIGVRAAPWAGIAFAVLLAVSLAVINRAPGIRSSDDEVSGFYRGSRVWQLELAVLYLVPLAGVCFLWFTGVLRYRLRLIEGGRVGLLATVQFAAGIIFLTLLFAAAAGLGSDVAAHLDGVRLPAASLRQVLAFSNSLLYVYASRAGAMFVLTTSVVGLRTRTLPPWLGIAGVPVAGVLMFAASLSLALALIFPAWVFIVSLAQFRHRHLGAAQ